MKNKYLYICFFIAFTLIVSCKKIEFNSFDNKGKTVLITGLNFSEVTPDDDSAIISLKFTIIDNINNNTTFDANVINTQLDTSFNLEFIGSSFVQHTPAALYYNIFFFNNADNELMYDENFGFFLEQYLTENHIGESKSPHTVQFSYYNPIKLETGIEPVNMDKFYEFNRNNGSHNTLSINDYLNSLNTTIDHLVNNASPQHKKHITLVNFTNFKTEEKESIDSAIYNSIKNKLILENSIHLNYIGLEPMYRINDLVAISGGFESISKRQPEYKSKDSIEVKEYHYLENTALTSSNVVLQNMESLLKGSLPCHELSFKLSAKQNQYFQTEFQNYIGQIFSYQGAHFYIPKL